MDRGESMDDFIECAPMYDAEERLALWYFNLRQMFVGHPEARIFVGENHTVIRHEDKVILNRNFGSDIDQNNWIGRMQAETLLADYEAACL
jgi:hypothetical protein